MFPHVCQYEGYNFRNAWRTRLMTAKCNALTLLGSKAQKKGGQEAKRSPGSAGFRPLPWRSLLPCLKTHRTLPPRQKMTSSEKMLWISTFQLRTPLGIASRVQCINHESIGRIFDSWRRLWKLKIYCCNLKPMQWEIIMAWQAYIMIKLLCCRVMHCCVHIFCNVFVNTSDSDVPLLRNHRELL